MDKDTVVESQHACTYAALLLSDGGAEITALNLMKVMRAANVEIEPFWADLFANALSGRDIHELVVKAALEGQGPATATNGNSSGQGQKPAEEEKKEEPRPVSSDSDSDDMGFGLFD
ncbi:uncharacterized protein LOC135813509 [Sycon ciliatum]|uniref:uncharacterized protein LOC135813509 n=1 Tax=Sycon ciliatum TaxID=27933 RepID=UPI0020ADF185|eukprot:scpid88957/ scgid15091/ 60S acidic ribosomal protein P1-alpha 5